MNFTLYSKKNTKQNRSKSYLHFDYDFYRKTYTDLEQHGLISKEQCLTHYFTCGKKEGRACCEKEMVMNYEKNMKQALEQNNLFPLCLPQKLHILMRTSNRPNSFQKAMESILQQTYPYFDVTICYDKPESLDYLQQYENHEKIKYFYVEEECNDKYKFNLYCNTLMKKIQDGYIMFLDDDDIYLGNRCLEIINYHIVQHDMVIWKFLRPDKVVYPSKSVDISLGEIDTSMVCFHYSLQTQSQWGSTQYGDYHFYKPLFENKQIKKQFIPCILTSTQFNNKIGNYGETEL